MTTLRPLHDYILVKRKDPEAMTKGGLYIPDTRQIKNRFAEVLAVGPGRFHKKTGKVRPVEVSVGQTVFFRGTAGQEIDMNNEQGYVFLREAEVDGVVEEP